MKKSTVTVAAICIALLPLAYLAISWSSLPANVPLHYNWKMEMDRTGPKEELWIVMPLLTVVSLGVYFLLTNLHRIDPKQKGKVAQAGFQRLAFVLVFFLSVINAVLISSAKNGLALQNLLFSLIGLLFAFMGNYMNSIKPNYFAGFRLPWTLSSDDNWRRTHQLAGRLWFGGGLLIALASLVLPLSWTLPFFVAVVLVLVVIPSVYSYRIFKNKSLQA